MFVVAVFLVVFCILMHCFDIGPTDTCFRGFNFDVIPYMVSGCFYMCNMIDLIVSF